jgi:hypothetical protein
MIFIDLRKEDLAQFKVEVRNLPGTLFGGSSPLLKPFMKKLECLMPEEKRGRGDSYTLGALHSHVDHVKADENGISVKSGPVTAEVTRAELQSLLGDRYPSSDHQRLNLPGLLFLQSSPALQQSAVAKLRREHNLKVPEGRRTLRYIFHAAVVSIDADKERIRIGLDLSRLPKMADGSSPLGMS